MEKKLPCIKTNFSDWYNEIVYRSELIDSAPIRGCIIMRPYGYAIWENMQQVLDYGIKKMGAENSAFPLLIPYSLFELEKEHIEGFSPEIAVVTHAGGKEIEESLAVRPTSEVIIHSMFSRWIKSWRDLPIKLNQWCSVIRWEKRPRPFIRTTEFWWQEGHTAHETNKEAYDQAYEARDLYENFIREYLSIPVFIGKKPAHERFAGAQATFTLEGMMQDGKALQMGTSHILGESFAKIFNIKYLNKEGKLTEPFLTSWGVTTRLIGAVIMVHGDNKGLIIPPKIAPILITIIPIYKSVENKNKISDLCLKIKDICSSFNLKIKFDNEESESPGFKFNKWELKGVPFRIEIGEKELLSNEFVFFRRDDFKKNKININILENKNKFLEFINKEINDFQKRIYLKADEYTKKNTFYGENIKEFGPKLSQNGGFYISNICDSEESIKKIKEFQGTIRCTINDEKAKKQCCVHLKNCENKENLTTYIIAKSY